MKLLKELSREKEEAKRIKIMKNLVFEQIKLMERYLREFNSNSFEKVYISLALEKIIEDLALQFSLGTVSVEKTEDSIIVRIENPDLTSTDIKNILDQDRHSTQVYTLSEALKEVDDFKIEHRESGKGIVFIAVKKLK
jgi:hypothetical protein